MRIGKDFYIEVPVVKIIHNEAIEDITKKWRERHWFKWRDVEEIHCGQPEHFTIEFWNGQIIEVYESQPRFTVSGGKYSYIVGKDAIEDVRAYINSPSTREYAQRIIER